MQQLLKSNQELKIDLSLLFKCTVYMCMNNKTAVYLRQLVATEHLIIVQTCRGQFSERIRKYAQRTYGSTNLSTQKPQLSFFVVKLQQNKLNFHRLRDTKGCLENLNSEQRIVANSGEWSQIVANSVTSGKWGGGGGKQYRMTDIWYPVPCSQPNSNLGWDFPAKKHRHLSGQKMF